MIHDRKQCLFVSKIDFVLFFNWRKKMKKRVMMVTANPFLLLLMEPLSMLIPSCSSICLALCSGLVRPWGILNQHQFRFLFSSLFIFYFNFNSQPYWLCSSMLFRTHYLQELTQLYLLNLSITGIAYVILSRVGHFVLTILHFFWDFEF